MGPLIDASTTSQEYEKNINVTLKRLRHSHLNNVIVSYLNIQFHQEKVLVIQIKQYMEIFIFFVQQKRNQMNLFPIVSSYISIISPYRLDIADKKGGLMVFVKSHILSRLNDFKIPSNIQIIPFEINLRKKKCLVASIYNTPSQKKIYFLWYLTNLLKSYSTRYEKLSFLVILTQKRKIK